MASTSLHSTARSPSGWSVWGQDRLVADLQNAVRSGPRHSYVLSGPRMSGKNAVALAFARALLCANPPSPGLACGVCSRCRRIGRGSYPDVSRFSLETQDARESSASKNLSLNISTVRAISASIALRPLESDWRIVIVDDVETMQETAQEAFLKTLEEPPRYVIIMLLTSDAGLLLPTIRSRCVVMRMQSASPATIADALVQSGIDQDRSISIADVADGLTGWAFRAAADERLLEARVQAIADARAWVAADPYHRMITATRLADQFSKDREAVFGRVLGVQRELRARMLNGPDVAGAAQALRAVDRALLHLEANVRPRLALQQMVLTWPEVR